MTAGTVVAYERGPRGESRPVVTYTDPLIPAIDEEAAR